ncbi:hypothetical protein [Duganella sp. BJB475]|uniref:hypothetical protein n=1 Tax=Duganella sp. BJB475 TaxID=2233914 RepID=UPI0011C1BF25|nr:hypothetical protein [Duganella sp. BJB475]
MNDEQRHRNNVGLSVGATLTTGFLAILLTTNHDVIGGVGLVGGCSMFIWGLQPWLASLMLNISKLTLQESTQRMLDAATGSVLEIAARRQGMAPNGPLCYLATYAFLNEIPIYGRQIPATQSRRLPNDLLFAHQFTDNARAVEDNNSHRVAYTDLMMKRSDLRTLIRKIELEHPAEV